ncbi:MAG: homogentisate 1,2-dioxygenase [Nevskiales bacterium]|nr:homogentisate 1,2-dioxygenase [Nevskiales bacterium]
MHKWIYRLVVEGRASRQAHADLPPGTFERELGREGFFGPATHMLHTHPPTGWTECEGALRPRAFDLTGLTTAADTLWEAPEILGNANVQMRHWVCARSMDRLLRNADGDQLLFLHAGAATLYCDYGHLQLARGDYLVLPRGTMWRIECQAPTTWLAVEATGSHFQLPDKGMVGEHAIFDPAMLDYPRIDDAFIAQQQGADAERDWRVDIKRGNRVSQLRYPFNPLDAVGWHGSLMPVRINVRDIRPLMSHRYHLPPSAHTTFVAPRFVVCTFVPRPFETDPGALKVPFFHNNDDYDEVIFYHAGDFFSRDNIGPGMLTLHPCGITHGPHPKALGRMFEQSRPATDEYAVMIDARDALEVAAAAAGVEQTDYHRSWRTDGADG